MLIAKAKDQLEDESRRMAFEFLMSYVESKPKMCMKIPNFVVEMFKLCMEFMLELEDDPDWAQHGDEEEDEDLMNYDVGLENVDRFAKAIETEHLLNVFPLVAAYMQQTWTHKVVGLMTLSQLAESIKDEAQVDQIVTQLVASFADPHPRVRYAALHAVGQTATDQQPYVQEKHGEMLVPKLIQCMDDPVDRCKSHACAAFVNLGEELEQEVMMGNMQALMGKLSSLLSSSGSHA